MEGLLGKLKIRVDNIESRLQHLEQKVEERLHDTRPIWEKVVADIAQLQEGQNSLYLEVKEIRTWQRDTSRRMSISNDTLVSIQADYRDIYDRLRGLELNRNSSNSSTGTGRPWRYPCDCSQPSARRISNCSTVSTPSATVLSLNARASETIVDTTACEF